MKRGLLVLPALLLAACSSTPPDLVVAPPKPTASASGEASMPTTRPKILPYPDNRRDDAVSDTLFGTEVKDPYRWLEDVKNPDVVAWADAQDKLARAELAKHPERNAIAKRLTELLYVDALSAPRKRKDRLFFSRRHADKEKAIVYVKIGDKGAEKVLFDPNAWAADGSVSLGTWVPSWDGKKVAYQLKKNNSDEATLKVIDVDTMKDSTVDVIEGAKYASPSWTPKSDGFFYTWLPTDPAIKPDVRPGFAEVRFHKLGEKPEKDELVHPKTGDPTKFIGGELTKDGKLFFLSIDSGWTSNDLFFRPGADRKAKWQKLSTPAEAHYRAEGHDGTIYLMTDWQAERWRIFKVDPKKPDSKDWKEIVPQHPTATMDGFSIIGGKLVIAYLDKAQSRMEIRDLDGKSPVAVDLGGVGSVTGLVGLPDEPDAYFGFESFTSPLEIRKFSIKDGKSALYSKTNTPVDSSKLATEQVFFKSKDGTEISMFVIGAKDAKKDGSGRVFLYGYGGFQVNLTPQFYATLFPWLERGGLLAIPNLRGGAEYGEAWHQAGMKLKKQNVFDDFVGAARFLIEKGYTKPERLVIAGASNGGLLVGAAMTQAPDLFAGVVCGVPLLDMVRYHQFGSGRTWISEYGSSENEAEFRALFAYSPYHHVEAGKKYPALLMLAADSDDRVDPLHARKFSAAIQDASTGGPVLLRVEKNSGHGGADLRKAEVQKGADRLAFALSVTEPRP
jgi:prolyl oligopeptidase